MILFIQFHNKYSPLWFIIDNIQNAKCKCVCIYVYIQSFFLFKRQRILFPLPSIWTIALLLLLIRILPLSLFHSLPGLQINS